VLESLLSQGFQADSPQNVLLHPGPLGELIFSLHSLPSLILGNGEGKKEERKGLKEIEKGAKEMWQEFLDPLLL